MKKIEIDERYFFDAPRVRSFEEKNARSLQLGKERLASGKTGQAMRMFAYNHALNQNKPGATAPAQSGTKWKVRVWKNNKVVKTFTIESDNEQVVLQKVKGLGIDWDKATVHDFKTMKQTKKFANANATKTSSNTGSVSSIAKSNNVVKSKSPKKEVKTFNPPKYLNCSFTTIEPSPNSYNGLITKKQAVSFDWGRFISLPGVSSEVEALKKITDKMETFLNGKSSKDTVEGIIDRRYTSYIVYYVTGLLRSVGKWSLGGCSLSNDPKYYSVNKI